MTHLANTALIKPEQTAIGEVLPASYVELERIYQKVIASRAKSIALFSLNSGEGVSTIVDALARRSAATGKQSLIVDFNLQQPRMIPSDIDSCWNQGNAPAPVPTSVDGVDMIPVPGDRASLLALKEPAVLEKFLKHCERQYQQIFIDVSPACAENQGNLSPSTMITSCDAAILVVGTGKSTQPQLTKVMAQLSQLDARLIGVVMNDQQNPLLRNELLRELDRISRIFPAITAWARRKILKSQLLSIKV